MCQVSFISKTIANNFIHLSWRLDCIISYRNILKRKYLLENKPRIDVQTIWYRAEPANSRGWLSSLCTNERDISCLLGIRRT